MATELQLGDVTVDVIFKDIKNVHLSVYPPTGRIRISAPDRMSIENIRVFAISKIGWIRKQQKKIQGQERESAREYIERESHYLWGKRYLLAIREKSGTARVTLEHSKIVLQVAPRAGCEHKRAVLDNWYRSELKSAVKPILAKWEKQLDVRVARFFVQKMKTKWGSSNPERGTIRLNLELAKTPPECLDYVILHEVVHFLVPGHGERFTNLMEHYLPNWRVLRQSLNEAPIGYFEWQN